MARSKKSVGKGGLKVSIDCQGGEGEDEDGEEDDDDGDGDGDDEWPASACTTDGESEGLRVPGVYSGM